MTVRRIWSSVGVAMLLALSAPVGAGARPPAPFASVLSLPSLSLTQAPVVGGNAVVVRLDSAPGDARAGDAYLLHGAAVNEGGSATRAAVVVHLLRVGSPPVAVGKTSLRLPAHDLIEYRVRVRLPRVLHDGSYALVACARDRCVTAERHVQLGPAARATQTVARSTAAKCASGAHSLSPFGSHVYPETGNGGYSSLHTDVFLNYDTESNLFLPGTHVLLTDQATQCLTDFSLDFERTSANTKDGPNMTVGAVLVNGKPAAFTFVQPTYPGDPTVRTIPIRAPTRPVSSRPSEGPRAIRSRLPAHPSCRRRTRTSCPTWTARSARRTSS